MAASHRTKTHLTSGLVPELATIAILSIFPLVFPFVEPSFALEPESLGLRLGMTLGAVRQEFVKNGIEITQIAPETYSVLRLPTSAEGIRETRLYFEREKLNKIVVLFAMPPPQPTADSFIDRYNEEKDKLTKAFGPPSQDFVEMKAPTPAERYEWLVRGRAYYRSSWKIPDQTKISLWLYGGDAGIVFMEIYEDSQNIR
jgi:hypothetical protein